MGCVSSKSISCSSSFESFRSLFWLKNTSFFLHFLLLGLSLGYGSHGIRDQEKFKERASSLPSRAVLILCVYFQQVSLSKVVMSYHSIRFPSLIPDLFCCCYFDKITTAFQGSCFLFYYSTAKYLKHETVQTSTLEMLR